MRRGPLVEAQDLLAARPGAHNLERISPKITPTDGAERLRQSFATGSVVRCRRMGSTAVTRRIAAPRGRVYAALLDPDAVVRWKFPAGMTCEVHAFEPRVGGAIHVSLTYDDPAALGKTSGRTDTYRGRFAQLVPDERVVEIDEFETEDPALQGAMTITIELRDSDDGGTELRALHEGLPPGVSAADNETGWHSALDRLAALVEG
jgi:uncharacterized protein YndB with AHSA1/START domain